MAKHEGREKTEGGAYVVSKQIQVVSRHKAESQKGRKHLSKKGRDTAKLGPNHKKPGDTYSPEPPGRRAMTRRVGDGGGDGVIL